MNRLCDTHVHVFDPSRFAYVPDRKFSPATATVDQLHAQLAHIGADRVVLVQPSVYGTDHRCLLDALHKLGPVARGIAVIDQDTSPAEIEQLDQSGVVGARLNLVVNHQESTERAFEMIQRTEPRLPSHWHIQLHVKLEMLAALTKHIQNSQRHFVLDHFGLPDIAQGTQSVRWKNMIAVMKTGQLYVKASAPYLTSKQSTEYSDMQPFVESLFNAEPNQLLWGSNWPHTKGTKRDANTPLTHIETFRNENDLRWKENCKTWTSSHWEKIAHTNADHLYFSKPLGR